MEKYICELDADDDESLKGCYHDDNVGCSDPLSEMMIGNGMWLLTEQAEFFKFVIASLVSFVSNFRFIS